MGSDIGIIIPCEFHEVRNKRKAEAYLRRVANSLQDTLKIKGVVTLMNDDYCDGTPLKEAWPDYLPEIWVPTYDATIYLADGFWYMFNGFRYHQLVYPPGTQWLRYDIFDIVRALGQNEAWYCSEYDIDDSVGIENYTLESWLAKAKNSDDGITEYDVTALIREGESLWDNQRRYYHDSFTDVFSLFEEMKERYAPYRLLGLSIDKEKQVRVEENGIVKAVPALFNDLSNIS